MEKYIENTALARDFCQGKSAKMFKKVYETKQPLRVTRNGKDYVVIMNNDEYLNLIDKINDYEKRLGVVKRYE